MVISLQPSGFLPCDADRHAPARIAICAVEIASAYGRAARVCGRSRNGHTRMWPMAPTTTNESRGRRYGSGSAGVGEFAGVEFIVRRGGERRPGAPG